MVEVKAVLIEAIARGASDVHINVDVPPFIRKNTELIELAFPAITDENARQMVISMVGNDRFHILESKRDLDFSTKLPNGHRFRVNAHYQRDTLALAFRVIPSEIPDIEELHLPPIAKELTDLPRGLVLVTGHTGSGKSTTLASMVG